MASNLVNVEALSQNLKENKKDYEKIFGLKVSNGFAAKTDFNVVPLVDKMELIRDEVATVSQPGRTGNINHKSGPIVTQKSRIPQLSPAKVDLYLDEIELHKLAVSYLGKKEPGDPRDLASFAGRTYLMGRIMTSIGKDINNALIKGQVGYQASGNATAFQNGLNLFDGLAFKFLTGYATSGAGAVGDIPGGNKVPNAAATLTEANILGELKKIVQLIFESPTLVEYRDEAASFFISPIQYMWILNALDALPYKADQVVTNTNGVLKFKLLPNTEIKARTYMNGVDNMFWSPNDNLFYLHADDTADGDITSIKFQEKDRGLQILMDWETSVDYADGRLIVLYK